MAIDKDAFMSRLSGSKDYGAPSAEPDPADPSEPGEDESLSPGEQLCHALGLPGGPDKDYAAVEEAVRRIVGE